MIVTCVGKFLSRRVHFLKALSVRIDFAVPPFLKMSYFSLILVWLLSPCLAMAQERARPRLTMVLAPGADANGVIDVMNLAQTRMWSPWPLIATMEPGPIDTRQGLRLLANQVAPGLTVPDLLLIFYGENLKIEYPFLAFLRRCLAEGGQIWVVGDRIPPALADVGLEPGQMIPRVNIQDLIGRLGAHWPSDDPPPLLLEAQTKGLR